MRPLQVLDQLENSELVRRSVDAEPTFVFKHTLTQESVYNALLKARRAELHRRVAEAIESLCGMDVEPSAAMLALHYERAGVDDKAFSYASLAGDIAARSFAHREAVILYDRALALARRSADSDWNARVRQVYSSRGRMLEVSGDHAAALANYQAMIAFAQSMGDMAMEADGLTHLLTTQGTLGDVPDADQKLMHALELARQSGDQSLIGRALWNLGLAVRFTAPLRAVDFFFQALEHARTAGLREIEGFILVDLGSEMQMIGHANRSLVLSRQALEVFRELDNKPMIANALGNLGEAYYDSGEAELARQASEEGAHISRSIGNPWGIAYNEWVLLALNLDAGEFGTAITRGADILVIAANLGLPLFPGMTNMVLSRVYAETNQLERANDIIELGIRQFAFVGSEIWAGLGAGLSAHIKFLMGRPDEARQLIAPYSDLPTWQSANVWMLSFVGRAAAEMAFAEGDLARTKMVADILVPRMNEQGLGRYSVALLYWRARAERALGELAAARNDLEQAVELATRAKNIVLLWKVHAELAALADAEHNMESANLNRLRARALITEIASHISDPILHQSFLDRPDVRHIL